MEKIEILFVCTGNTCRSPMAQRLFQAQLKAWALDEMFAVYSAGLAAAEGSSASTNACLAIQAQGLDLHEHCAKQLTREMVEHATVVLTMTVSHKQAILQSMPEMVDKVFTLAEYAGEKNDVMDPYGGDLATYEECVQWLCKYLKKLRANVVLLSKKF